MNGNTPTEQDVITQLGKAYSIWCEILASLEKRYGALIKEWKPSKKSFGWMYLLKQKKRTLLYMTPEEGEILIGIVLGERAADTALKSKLPDRIKEMIREARAYAEGRGIRFPVRSLDDIALVDELVDIKMAPR